MVTEEQATLQSYGDAEGTTTDPREHAALSPVDDGHCPYADPDVDHWTDNWGKPTPHPAGSWAVVLQPSFVERTPTHLLTEVEAKSGVYIGGRHYAIENLQTPPTPVEASDEKLREAAEAGLQAVASIADDLSTVAVVSSGTSWGSLNFADTRRNDSEPKEEFTADFVGIPENGADLETYEGFTHIRRFATPARPYSDYEEPRLELGDLNIPAGFEPEEEA